MLVLLLVKRTITDRAAAIFAPICQVRRPNCLLLDTLGLIPSYNIGRAEVHSPTSLTPGCLTTPQTPEPPPTGPMSSLAVAPRRHTRTTGPGHESAPRGDAIAANQKRYVRLRRQGTRNKNQSSSDSSSEDSSANSLNMKSFWYSIRNCVERFRSTKRP